MSTNLLVFASLRTEMRMWEGKEEALLGDGSSPSYTHWGYKSERLRQKEMDLIHSKMADIQNPITL